MGLSGSEGRTVMQDLHNVLRLLEAGFAQVKVLVIGDLMLDRYIHGEAERLSPESPVPVLRHVQRYERPGGAANVAMNLRGLGCEAVLAGFWGEDNEAAELQRLLDAAGVDTVGVVTSTLPTTSKTRILARTQQMLRLDIETREEHSAEEAARLTERCVDLVPKVHAVVLSDYAKGALSRELCDAVIRAARYAKVPVLADPKTRDLSKFSGATVVCPNLAELSLATGVSAGRTEEMFAAARAQMREHDTATMAVTRSEKGITVLHGERTLHFPAQAREVFDVSGAGDTVIATLAAGLAGGLGLETAVELANLAAGIVVGKVGTAPIARAELVAELTPSSGIASAEKVLTEERLLQRVAEWREAGERIVLTNGCFDLLHVGHVTLLEECKRFGAKLVLALNTDASIARLKGPSRPVVGEAERARVMAALAAVDAVVLFEEDTPLRLIGAVKPDVLVKGGDYTVASVVGHEEVLARGGRVEIVPTVEGFSTTNLVRKLTGDGG